MSEYSTPAPESPIRWSDKENTPRTLVVRDKGKGPAVASKRKRSLTNGAGPSHSRRRTREPEGGGEEEEDEDEEEEDDLEHIDSEQYDPDQSIEERRNVQRGLRDLLRDLTENNDEYLQVDSKGLHDTLRKANKLAAGVKQTTEATIDSKLLVSTVNASYRKTVRLTAGNIARGIDVDELVSKSIAYMRLGGVVVDDDAPELSSTQRQRRRPSRGGALGGADGSDDDENDDDGDMFNWEHLGKFACLPEIRRPATPGFLLGPLSVQKKIRKIVKRSAPFKSSNLPETRPEVLDPKDVERDERNDLAGICTKILQRLVVVQERAQDAAEDAFDIGAEDETKKIMEQHGLRNTGGIDLFKFVVNPKSFGQTVENMFYVSFLIRDGKIGIEFDENGLPTLLPTGTGDAEPGAARHAAQKQQAVLSIDMATWRDLIEAFDIKQPLIEHRNEQSTQGPGARGWYS
ncbi:Nse4 C-terminal-domain-containing protein [Pseudomassariella vexata]|uniref:Non-structural maintenance of chromosomes element 4 n=1 Tax=Pseudomassariella vexata TaxID=1141098 RepID=A0A1Y2E7U5_9PEZI|nr:Nse4 C-terminal-domain-containing protein [Pseudomassariella vexata]ORY67638.1 Nse4 C-terminal-domain-containing protein [Pseudomassariella vexata]